MNKIWYLIIEGQQEGPYSVRELRRDQRITPDTLVWKEGWPEWIPAGHVSELKELFEEDAQVSMEDEEVELTPEGELTMEMRPRQPLYFVIYIVAFILMLYILYSFYGT